MSNINYENLSAFHPGYYVNDLIEDLDMTQEEFAKRLNITPKNLSELINGKAPMSRNIAKNLSVMLGTSVEVWLDLQKKYDQKLIEIKIHQAFDIEKNYLQDIDYSYFENLGVVGKFKEKKDRINALLSYLSISSFSVFTKPDFLIQFRKTVAIDEKLILNSNIWVQTAINQAKQVNTQSFAMKKLRSTLPELRNMTVLEFEDTLPVLRDKLSECGIALVLLPSLKNSGVFGATKWLNKNKVLVALSDRGKYLDGFWFSLFHELGHVMQKKMKKTLVEMDNMVVDDILEIEANEFAKNILIPISDFNEFKSKQAFSETSVIKFSNSINVDSGIIVGRLQKEGYIEYSKFNSLRKKFKLNH